MSLTANPVWESLRTRHRHLAVWCGLAGRYPAAVAPFVAVAEPSERALGDLRQMLDPGESVWLVGDYPRLPGLVTEETIELVRMALPGSVDPPQGEFESETLSCGDAREMVALTDVAFPGFFRVRTCEMGRYYGVREGGELVAMGGERLAPEGYTEISGVCTHPEHRGRGYAGGLIWQLVREHRREGLVSWLHVTSTNGRARELYRRMGFLDAGRVPGRRIRRESDRISQRERV